MEDPMSIEKIPHTDSIQELARFWDTHDLTDFEDELEEVSGPVFQRDSVATIHLQPSEIDAVKEMAKSEGVGYVDLIRKWVLEKIQVR